MSMTSTFFHSVLSVVGFAVVSSSSLRILKCVVALATVNALAAANNNNNISSTPTKSDPIFGHDLKQKYFMLAEDFTNLNHGSFGTVARPVMEAQHDFFLQQESRPDTWFRETYFTLIEKSREILANLIKADINDVVLVENASSAVNAILRSLGFKKGDKVLRLSTAYGMVINTLDWMVTTLGIEVVVVTVDFPVIDEKQILASVKAALEANPDVKMCIFSHISSMPAMIEPVKELTKLTHDAGALALIDAAHAPGVIDIDISDINPDFYLGNCHKWLYAPKGTAFLWVSKPQQTSTSPEPTVISSSGEPSYIGRFRYTGTRDYTGFAALPAALAFVDTLGGLATVQRYNHGLALQAAEYLARAWGTYLLIPESMTGYMFNVVLPTNNVDKVAAMQAELDKVHNLYMVYGTATSSLTGETIIFTRLSAQVYLELSDFEKLAGLVSTMLE